MIPLHHLGRYAFLCSAHTVDKPIRQRWQSFQPDKDPGLIGESEIISDLEYLKKKTGFMLEIGFLGHRLLLKMHNAYKYQYVFVILLICHVKAL